MENYITLLVATLEHLELVSEKEGEKLEKELKNTTLPGTYREARVFIKDVFEKIGK
jgi:hypothetical protein